MGTRFVKTMRLPLFGHVQIEMYFGSSGKRLMGHCVLRDLPEDGDITRFYHIGCLCIVIRDVRPDGDERAVHNRRNDQRFLLRAYQFDPSKMELGRSAQHGAPETNP
jgi:hypothetical protein